MFNSTSSSLFEPWLKFKNPIVRQLAFTVASPNILQSIPDDLNITHPFQLHDSLSWQQHYVNYEKRLEALDRDCSELSEFVAQLKSTRLGLRFEMLFWFWLLDDAYHHYKLIQHSIQIIDGPRTVGELDFLVFNTQTQAVEHWEVALKYYLAEQDFSLKHWYGLNRSDTLARKLNHFTEKQFQFNQVLNQSIDARFAILKGQLYLPEYNTNQPHPVWVNPQRRIGTWGQQLKLETEHFYRLERQEWICPNASETSDTALWWTDGLYHQTKNNAFYMYRAPTLISHH
jgi:uncharacterized protein